MKMAGYNIYFIMHATFSYTILNDPKSPERATLRIALVRY